MQDKKYMTTVIRQNFLLNKHHTKKWNFVEPVALWNFVMGPAEWSISLKPSAGWLHHRYDTFWVLCNFNVRHQSRYCSTISVRTCPALWRHPASVPVQCARQLRRLTYPASCNCMTEHFPSPGHVPGTHYHLTLNWFHLVPASARNSRRTSSVFYSRDFLLVFNTFLLVFCVCVIIDIGLYGADEPL